MALDSFQATLARLIADPAELAAVRADSANLVIDGAVTRAEWDRLLAMAADDPIEVLCSLYRSNRLTALVRTVPELVDALGDDLSATVSAFWRDTPRTDLQFRSESIAFCEFVAATFAGPVVGVAGRLVAALRVTVQPATTCSPPIGDGLSR